MDERVVTTPELDRDVCAYLRLVAEGKRRRVTLVDAQELYDAGLRYWGRLWARRVAQLNARRVMIGQRMRGRR